MRDPGRPEGQLEVAHLRDPPGVPDRVEVVRELRGHLVRGLEVEVIGLELQPTGRVEVGGGPDAQQHVVGLVLGPADVVEVVGDDQRQVELRGETQQLLVEPPLLGQAVVLHLQEEPVLPEDLRVVARDRAGEVPVLDLQGPRDLAVEAGGQADQPVAVLREVLAVDPGLVVVAVDVGVGDQAAEVPVAGQVLGEQDQVEGLGVGLALLVGHRPAGDVGLDADDRLDALVRGRLVERDGAVEGAVVRDREAVEALLPRLVDELRDPPEAVKERELGVRVEVDEVVGGERQVGHQQLAVDRRPCGPARATRERGGGVSLPPPPAGDASGREGPPSRARSARPSGRTGRRSGGGHRSRRGSGPSRPRGRCRRCRRR